VFVLSAIAPVESTAADQVEQVGRLTRRVTVVLGHLVGHVHESVVVRCMTGGVAPRVEGQVAVGVHGLMRDELVSVGQRHHGLDLRLATGGGSAVGVVAGIGAGPFLAPVVRVVPVGINSVGPAAVVAPVLAPHPPAARSDQFVVDHAVGIDDGHHVQLTVVQQPGDLRIAAVVLREVFGKHQTELARHDLARVVHPVEQDLRLVLVDVGVGRHPEAPQIPALVARAEGPFLADHFGIEQP